VLLSRFPEKKAHCDRDRLSNTLDITTDFIFKPSYHGHKLDWLTSYSYNKGLLSRIYRELKNLNPQRINNPVNKWAHELNRKFSKEEVQMANKYLKCSNSLTMKEMQIKTTLRFHLTSVRMAILKNKNNNKW
jgi:hypothetical protein